MEYCVDVGERHNKDLHGSMHTRKRDQRHNRRTALAYFSTASYATILLTTLVSQEVSCRAITSRVMVGVEKKRRRVVGVFRGMGVVAEARGMEGGT